MIFAEEVAGEPAVKGLKEARTVVSCVRRIRIIELRDLGSLARIGYTLIGFVGSP